MLKFRYNVKLLIFSLLAWIFTWDREELAGAFVILIFIFVTLYICMGISFYGISSNKNIMLKQGLSTEIRLVIGNGKVMHGSRTQFVDKSCMNMQN